MTGLRRLRMLYAVARGLRWMTSKMPTWWKPADADDLCEELVDDLAAEIALARILREHRGKLIVITGGRGR